jgi:hypothetical protein
MNANMLCPPTVGVQPLQGIVGTTFIYIMSDILYMIYLGFKTDVLGVGIMFHKVYERRMSELENLTILPHRMATILCKNCQISTSKSHFLKSGSYAIWLYVNIFISLKRLKHNRN